MLLPERLTQDATRSNPETGRRGDLADPLPRTLYLWADPQANLHLSHLLPPHVPGLEVRPTGLRAD